MCNRKPSQVREEAVIAPVPWYHRWRGDKAALLDRAGREALADEMLARLRGGNVFDPGEAAFLASASSAAMRPIPSRPGALARYYRRPGTREVAEIVIRRLAGKARVRWERELLRDAEAVLRRAEFRPVGLLDERQP